MISSLTGRSERRLALVIFLSALIPLAVSVSLGASLFRQASSIWFDPEVGEQLDRGVDVYKDYVRAVKDDMRHQADVIASDQALREAARRGNSELELTALESSFSAYPNLVALRVVSINGRTLASHDRGRRLDTNAEKSLEVRRPLGDAASSPILVATFAVDRKRFDELESAGNIVAKYHQLEASRNDLYQGFIRAFSVLIGLTLALTLPLGFVLARGVTRRVRRLASAIERVAAGDFSVRVPVTGSDELTELASAFNRMVDEMAGARARIEYLQRMGAWQEMAQRLAHEIKNPLTPIQLAVQQCHRKYNGDSEQFRALLDTTLEIVEEEVATLRRLVGTFSDFARMPHAEPQAADVAEFLREFREQFSHIEEALELGDGIDDVSGGIDIEWRIPDEVVSASIDRQMLRRVLVNLVRNAAQAIRSSPAKAGRIIISIAQTPTTCFVVVEDSGPGILESDRIKLFDPYFTTKSDGTGLGLAIAKKIVIEHGGEVEALGSSELGGAKFVIALPVT